MPCGVTVEGAVTSPGQLVHYAFEAQAGDRIHAGMARGSGVSWNPKLELISPFGGVLRTEDKTLEAVLDHPGTYLLQVRDGLSNGTGEFRLRLDWIAPRERQCAREIRCGAEEVGATFEDPFRAFYRFEGLEGDRVLIGIRKLNGVSDGFWFPRVRVYTPSGVLALDFQDPPSGSGSRTGSLVLPMSGSFTISVGDNNLGDPNAHGGFRLFLDILGPPQRACSPTIDCGEVASGESTALGDVDVYQFEGQAGDRVRVETFEDEGTAFWSPEVVVIPPHEPIPLPFQDDFGSIDLPADGNYSVVVFDAASDGHGRHRLQLERYGPTERACGPLLACGIPFRGTLVAPRDHDFVYFDAEVGDVVDISVAAESRRALFWSPRASLRRPDGTLLSGPLDHWSALTIPATGRYALEIQDGGEDSSGAYRVLVSWVLPAAKQCPTACVTPLPSCGTGRSIEVVDPNEPLLRDLLPDPALLAVGGRAVEGLAADGVTPVLLRLRGFVGPGTVSLSVRDACSGQSPREVGILRDPLGGASASTLDLPLVSVPGSGWMAFAVLTAPLNFAESEVSREAPYRKLTLEAFAASGCAARELWLFRPPVVLVHGLWGDATTWTWRSMPFDNGAGLRQDDQNLLPDYVYVHDYRLTNGGRAAQNAVDLRRSIASALLEFRGTTPDRLQLAATQVDLVTHSFGGFVTRNFLSDSDAYYRPDNFLSGDVHKLLTLGTPHFGSPWADLFTDLVQSGEVGSLVADLTREFGFCLDCGAVEDLQASSMASTPVARAFTHTIVGTGGSDYIQSGQSIPERLFQDETTFVLDIVIAVQRALFVDLLTLVFGDARHDMLVAESSARAAVSPDCTSSFSFLDGFHTFLTKSFKVERRARDLLSLPIRVESPHDPFQFRLPSGAEAAALGVGAGPGPGTTSLPRSRSFGAIEIHPLLPLTGLEAGDAVAVEIVGLGGFVPTGALVLTKGPPELLLEPPLEAVCRIAPDGLGVLPLAAIAWDEDGALAVATELVITLQPGAHLRSIGLTPERLDLFPYETDVQLAVYASYDDATIRAIEPDAPLLNFQSSAPQVATVDSEGRVHAVSEGVATILCSYVDSRGDQRSGQVEARVLPRSYDDARASAVRVLCDSNVDVYSLGGSHGGRPVLGGTLEFRLDLASSGHSRAVIVAVAEPARQRLPGGRVMCVDRSSASFFRTSSSGQPVVVPIPPDPILAGLRVYTQALLQGGNPLSLSNAWSLRLGSN